MRAVTIGAGALMLAGCAHLPFGHKAVPRGGETITYRLRGSPICFACASYTVTLGPDGQGIFTGDHGTAVTGDRRFRATPEQVRRFGAALAPYRPRGERLLEGPPACTEPGMTDQDIVDVRWQAADGIPAHLGYYGGCDPRRLAAMANALSTAPMLLPIADLIGPH